MLPGPEPIGAIDELTLGLHGFALTHLDAIGHVYRGQDVYNGRQAASSLTPGGLTCCDMLAQKDGIFTRGVLLNIAAVRGAPWMSPDDGVTAADLDAAERRQGVRVESGDVIFVYTGLQTARGGGRAGEPGPAGRHHARRDALDAHARDRRIFGGLRGCFPNPYSLRYCIYFHAIALAAMGLILLDIPALEPLLDLCTELIAAISC